MKARHSSTTWGFHLFLRKNFSFSFWTQSHFWHWLGSAPQCVGDHKMLQLLDGPPLPDFLPIDRLLLEVLLEIHRWTATSLSVLWTPVWESPTSSQGISRLPPCSFLIFSLLSCLIPVWVLYMLLRGDGTYWLDLAGSHAPHYSPRPLPWIPKGNFFFRPSKMFFFLFLFLFHVFCTFLFYLLLVSRCEFTVTVLHYFNKCFSMSSLFYAPRNIICTLIILTTIAACLYDISWLLKSFHVMWMAWIASIKDG